MTDVEALAWAREILGEPGPYIRETIPGVLVGTHDRYVATQRSLGLADASPYGLMWLGVPQALVDTFQDVAGVQLHRPKRGRYLLPVVNGVPLIAWRYAKDAKTDLKSVPFGRPVSETRKSMFTPKGLIAELPLGDAGLGDAVVDDLTDEQRELFDEYGTQIRNLATEGTVGVLAYASNTDALLKAYFGYATLSTDGLLNWIHLEELELSSVSAAIRDVSTSRQRPTFDSGPLETPKMRPRAPFETGPVDPDAPPTGPTGTHE